MDLPRNDWPQRIVFLVVLVMLMPQRAHAVSVSSEETLDPSEAAEAKPQESNLEAKATVDGAVLLGNPQRAGFRGEITDVTWSAPESTAGARPDVDLVAMGRWAQHFLVNNARPALDYACRFSLDRSCPPIGLDRVDTVADGDTDCRLDWEYMFLAEMCGVGKTAESAAGVRRRILSYLDKANLASGMVGMYCGGDVPNDAVAIWTTGHIMVSLAETFARTGDTKAKERAREVFVALRSLASWDTGRAWYAGGIGPYKDGKWYDTFGTFMPGCQTEHVFRYWELTADPEALEFAKALAHGTVDGLQENMGCSRFRSDGSFSAHTHLHTYEVWGVAHVGAVLHERELTEWAKRVYEYVRSRGADYGWFPERVILNNDKPSDGFEDRVHISETCATGDMVCVAAWLARGGYPEYWDHVERYLRNYIRSVQFFWPPEAENKCRQQWRAEGKSEQDIEAAIANIRGYQGGFGAMMAVNAVSQHSCGCCAGSGMRALYTAWKNAVIEDSRGVWINMSFNRGSPSATVVSSLPDTGRLSVTVKKPCDFHLRPPSWAPRGEVRSFRDAKPITLAWEGDYVLFRNAAEGERLVITYPLPQFTQTLNVGGKLEQQTTYRMEWKGNTYLKFSDLPPCPPMPD